MLTEYQIDARRGKLTASRIGILMQGVAEDVLRLYLEMTDQQAEEDLWAVWPVQLGATTEQLNLYWFELKQGHVTRRGEVVTHPLFRWAACTLDGWSEELRCPIECKHVGGREPVEVTIERYQPQMQWQMEITGATQCAISIIRGADEPIVEFIEKDEEYCEIMLERGEQFMGCVRNRTPPVELVPVTPPDYTANHKIYNMESNNYWAAAAASWLETIGEAKANKDAEKILKACVPADAKRCHGHGVQITRDKAGRLSLREKTE